MASKFEKWARDYRRAAKADGFQEMSEWLESEGWDNSVEAAAQAVEESIHFVELWVRRGDKGGILPLQVYDPAAARSRYVVTFRGGEHDRVRFYCDDPKPHLDLVDLHNEGAGCQVITFSTVGDRLFEPGECAKLEQMVKTDFSHDYGHDEIYLDFDSGDCFLQVEVRMGN